MPSDSKYGKCNFYFILLLAAPMRVATLILKGFQKMWRPLLQKDSKNAAASILKIISKNTATLIIKGFQNAATFILKDL